MPGEQWPSESLQRTALLQDFDYSSDWGDRRQEIVFIGVNMNEGAIIAQLDTALLTAKEMERYSSEQPVAMF